MNKKIVSAFSLATFVMFQLSAKPMSFASTNPGVSGWVKAVLIAIGTLVLLFFLIFNFAVSVDMSDLLFFISPIFIIAGFFIFPTVFCGLIGGGLLLVVCTPFYVKAKNKPKKEEERIKHDARLLFEANKNHFMEILELVGGADNIDSIQNCLTRVKIKLKTEKNIESERVRQHPGIMALMFDGILLQLFLGQKCSEFHYALEIAIEETRAEKEKQRQKKEEEKKQRQHQLEEQRKAIVAQQKETEQQREEENRQSQLKKLVKKVEDSVLLFQSSVDRKEPVNLQLLKMIEDALSEMQSCKNMLEKHDKEELKRNKKYCKVAFEEAKKLECFTQSANVRMDEILKMFDDVTK